MMNQDEVAALVHELVAVLDKHRADDADAMSAVAAIYISMAQQANLSLEKCVEHFTVLWNAPVQGKPS